MYAIIESGGKQHKVSLNDVVKLETLNAEIGSTYTFDHVLMVANGEDIKIGTPYVPNIKVFGEIVSEGRHKKIHVMKFRRRKHSMKQAGHRQNFTEVKITAIGDTKPEPKEKKETVVNKPEPDTEAKENKENIETVDSKTTETNIE